ACGRSSEKESADLIIATLAVVLTWGVAVVVLAGCGYAVRLGLQRVTGIRGPDGLAWADVWIGLASAVAYAHVWSLVAAVRWTALVVPAAVAALGWARAARVLARPARVGGAFTAGVTAAAGLVVLWLANLALGPPSAYDSGLYHFDAIGYI